MFQMEQAQKKKKKKKKTEDRFICLNPEVSWLCFHFSFVFSFSQTPLPLGGSDNCQNIYLLQIEYPYNI
jgi:hypothetical protein